MRGCRVQFLYLTVVASLCLAASTALAGPTSRTECHALYNQHVPLAQRLSEEARRQGEHAWEIATSSENLSRGNRAARPYYAEAERLRDEASSIRRQASQERNRCFNEVRAYQQREAANRSLEAKRHGVSNTLGQGLLRQGVNETAEGVRDAASKKLERTVLGGKWGNRYSQYSRIRKLFKTRQEARALRSGKQMWKEKYHSFFNITSTLTSEMSAARGGLTSRYSLAHALSGKVSEMVLDRLKSIHLHSLNEFEKAMAEFNTQYRITKVQKRARILEAAKQATAETKRQARIAEAERRAETARFSEKDEYDYKEQNSSGSTFENILKGFTRGLSVFEQRRNPYAIPPSSSGSDDSQLRSFDPIPFREDYQPLKNPSYIQPSRPYNYSGSGSRCVAPGGGVCATR